MVPLELGLFLLFFHRGQVNANSWYWAFWGNETCGFDFCDPVADLKGLYVSLLIIII